MSELRRSPYIHAYLEPSPLEYSEGCYHFRNLLQSLSDIGPDLQGWQVHNSMESGPDGTGIDAIENMDAAIAFYSGQGLNNPDGRSAMVMTVDVWREHYGAKEASYTWNRSRGSDEFSLKLDYPSLHPPATLDRFISIAELVIRWQNVRYLWCGDRQYWSKQHQLYAPERLPAGWFCWVPQQVKPEVIPSAWQTGSFLEGTLIVTQPDYFNINDNAPAIHRANAVEYEMNEAGILPLLNDLVGVGLPE